MRKKNTTFVKSMIITAVIGFSVLMMMMFIGIKYYVDKSGSGTEQQVSNVVDKRETKVDYSSAVLALVQKIDNENLVAFDIHNNQIMKRSLSATTKVSDGYGAAIPISAIKTGDIIEVIFQPDKERILSINKTSRSWIKPDISGVIINAPRYQVTIGKKTYSFSTNTMVFREDGRGVSPSFIGEYDILELQGVEDVVWSIKVLKSGATLELVDLPHADGMLEIDRTRMIPLSSLTETIGLTPGNHKLQINIKGYEPIIEDINFIAGEHHQISLKDAKEAFTELNVKVANPGVNYTVQVGDKTFAKGEKISLKYDKYTIIVEAEGHESWEREIELDTSIYDLNVTLEKLAEEIVREPINPGGNNPPTSNANYSIEIFTDPVGAYVYIDGTYKGQTPFKTKLPVGDYVVSLEKSGYQNYSTTIMIDNSDNQNSFLYVLTPQ